MSSPTKFVSIDTTAIDGCTNSLVAMGDGREIADISPMRAVLAERDAGRPVALVTIICATGSAPRGMGSQMAVRADGSIVGTVGGGNLELYAIRHALESLKDGCPRQLHYDFTGKSTQNVEKACTGTSDFIIQPFMGTPHLVLFGAGHIARALSPLAVSCGFRVTVADSRAEFLDPNVFPAEVKLVHGDFVELAKTAIPFDAQTTYAAIMTYGHSHDEEVLDACLERPCRYLGLVGSRAKLGQLWGHLGTTERRQELLRNVHAPIGFDLGGRSPAEIAVSIMSEILAVRYNKPTTASLARNNNK